MVRDRFHEFQQRSRGNHLTNTGTPSSVAVVGPSDALAPDELGAARLAQRAQQFLDHVNELRQSVDRLKSRLEELQQKQAAVLSQSTVRPEHKAQLSALIDEIREHIRSLRPRVRQIDVDLRRDERDGDASHAELRIRRNHCEMLKMRLNELLELFEHTHEEYKSRVSKRVKRQLDMVGEHVSNADVDRMLESKSQEVFYQTVRAPSTRAAHAALDDATTRHNEILELERSIAELNDVFRDMYDIVHSQNAMVDHIATNVASAGEYVRDAGAHVTRAVSYKRASRRRKYTLMLIVVVLLFALSAIVGVALWRALSARS